MPPFWPYHLLAWSARTSAEGRAAAASLGTGSVVVGRFGSAARFEYVERGGQEGDGGGPAEIAEEAFELVWPVCVWGAQIRFSCCEAVFVDQPAQ